MFIHKELAEIFDNSLMASIQHGWQPGLTKNSAHAKIKLTPSILMLVGRKVRLFRLNCLCYNILSICSQVFACEKRNITT